MSKTKSEHTLESWVFEYRRGTHPLNDQNGWGCRGLWVVNGGLILGDQTGWNGGYAEPSEAHKKLIVAAPETAAERDQLKIVNAELLGRLEKIEHYADMADGSNLRWFYMNVKAILLRQAIAKATK